VLLVTRALPAELRALLPGARARSADP
jgi:hypothetical protein